ncbi:MAG: TlpA family protein disulfide reductase [Phycisphaerales bacterium]|nr:TlpA family protein disulfide reductase [Phycisphaerales bacterium]
MHQTVTRLTLVVTCAAGLTARVPVWAGAPVAEALAPVDPPGGTGPRDAEITTLTEGEQLLAQARRAYAEAATYRDDVTVTYESFSRDAGLLPAERSVSHVRFALRNPGDYRYERWPGDEVLRTAGGASLGGKVTVWVGDWGQAISAPARTPTDPEELSTHTWGTVTFDHPLAPSLLHLDRPDILSGLERVEDVRVEIVGNRECLRLGGHWSGASLMTGEPAPGAIWIDRRTFEVRRFGADVSQMYLASMLDAPGLAAAFERATLLIEFARAELNADLGDEVFAFNPPEGMRVLKAFDLAQATPLAVEPQDVEPGLAPGREPGIVPGRQRTLIGQSAPDFSGDALDGAPFDLRDLRGRIVVLDFWATWCSPCLAAMPSMRGLAERFEGKGVTFIGISLDASDARGAIRDVVARERLPYRQFHDADGAVSGSYRVSGIPCVVLIDRAGVVRFVHVGFGPSDGARLTAEIDAMLSGTDKGP